MSSYSDTQMYKEIKEFNEYMRQTRERRRSRSRSPLRVTERRRQRSRSPSFRSSHVLRSPPSIRFSEETVSRLETQNIELKKQLENAQDAVTYWENRTKNAELELERVFRDLSYDVFGARQPPCLAKRALVAKIQNTYRVQICRFNGHKCPLGKVCRYIHIPRTQSGNLSREAPDLEDGKNRGEHKEYEEREGELSPGADAVSHMQSSSVVSHSSLSSHSAHSSQAPPAYVPYVFPSCPPSFPTEN